MVLTYLLVALALPVGVLIGFGLGWISWEEPGEAVQSWEKWAREHDLPV